MAGTLRLSNTGTGNGQSTITTAASGDTTYTLPSGGGTFVTTSSTQALTVPFASGTASAPSVTFLGDSNTGIYSPGADQVAVATNGTGRLFVDASGNVGVGTSSVNALLEVNNSTAGGEVQRIEGNYSGSGSVILTNWRRAGGSVAAAFKYNDDSSPLCMSIGTTTSHEFRIRTADTDAITIDASQRVGIGTSTFTDNLLLSLKSATGTITCGILLEDTGTSGRKYGVYSGSGKMSFRDFTAGENRLTIDSSGRVGIGTTSPGTRLWVSESATGATNGTNDIAVFDRNAEGYIKVLSPNNTTGGIAFGDPDDNFIGAVRYDHSSDNLNFFVNNSERLRITSAGLVGIGTSSPQKLAHISNTYNAPTGGHNAETFLIVSNGLTNSNACGIEIQGGRSGASFIEFGDPDNADVGRIVYSHSANSLATIVNGSVATFIDSSGRVGIGTTSPGANLDLAGTTSRIRWDVNNAYTKQTCANAAFSGFAQSITSAAEHIFQISDGEKARLDTSGRLLVGTSSSPSGVGGYGRLSPLVVQGYTGGATAGGYMSLQRGETAANITSSEEIGWLHFNESDGFTFAQIGCYADANAGSGDYPGRLVFSTTADGASSPTERMRIDRYGSINMYSIDGANVLQVRSSAAAGTGSNVFAGFHGATSTITGTVSVIIRTNGNVVNTNNSYGAISDIKLKENIVDANSQWDDIKALRPVNYNFKEGQTHTQIGLVAQEVELVSPGLVSESPDRDGEGNDLGTVTKSVNYSVLYMKAVKALQEAMERIETLEASNADLLARVSALESA
jgi:hypothetical protein